MNFAQQFKKLTLINIGIVLLAIGLYFLLLPSQLVVGGLSGFATVLHYHIPKIPVGGIMLSANVVLFGIAFLFLGKEFGGYSIYASLVLSLVIMGLERFIPMNAPLVDDVLLNLIFGIIISGIGIAIIFYQNASTGGTDIIAKIINKYTGLEIGRALLIADFLVIVMAAATFGLKLGMYALLGNLFNMLVIDNLIAGFNKKLNITINSRKVSEINRYINSEIERGTTLYEAVGGYSNEPRRILQSVVSKKEYLKIQEYVKKVDPEAFITLNFVSEVHGRGFSLDKEHL